MFVRNHHPCRRWITVLGSLSFVAALSTPARADVSLFKSEGGWEFLTDGRANGFLNYQWGDNLPADRNPPHPVVAGAGFGPSQLDEEGKFNFARVRSGFIGNILGFTVKKTLSEDTSVRAHTAIWSIIESAKDKAGQNIPDIRETYLKVDGPWGGLLVGRALGLFSRGAVTLDAQYEHGNGLGVNCPQGLEGRGPTCGHVGFGILFPGFNSQITYNTPVLGGFQLTAGIFDPVNLTGKYDRTPVPRPEAELTYDNDFVGGKVHAFVNGMWQPLYETAGNARDRLTADPTDDPKLRKVYAEGAGFGAWGEISALRLGFAGHVGNGLGYIYALENQNAQVDAARNLRKYSGFYGTIGLTLGKLYLTGGVGATFAKSSPQDDTAIALSIAANVLPQEFVNRQLGESVGVYYSLADQLIWAVDYFHADISFYLGDKQKVDTLNTGLSFIW
jgi:Gram-negative porin